LQVRTNLLVPIALESVHEVSILYLNPLPDFDSNFLKGKWIYEGVDPLPAAAKSLEASPFFPVL
jgi:hypothetical protein